MRAFGEWLTLKFSEAKLIDIAGTITGVILVAVGIVAACIYDGQLKEMRHTNELTSRALDAGNVSLEHTLSKMQSQVEATTRMAAATERGNTYAIIADRPIVSGVITVSDFELGKVPHVHIALRNSGKRSAFLERSDTTAGIFKVVPDSFPYAQTMKTFSSAVLDPGGTATLDYAMRNGPLTQVGMNDFRTGYWVPVVFLSVSYKDLLVGSRHFTHRCIYFKPGEVFLEEGFYDCRHYNDSN